MEMKRTLLLLNFNIESLRPEADKFFRVRYLIGQGYGSHSDTVMNPGTVIFHERINTFNLWTIHDCRNSMIHSGGATRRGDATVRAVADRTGRREVLPDQQWWAYGRIPCRWLGYGSPINDRLIQANRPRCCAISCRNCWAWTMPRIVSLRNNWVIKYVKKTMVF